jgi:hypothetical protein
MKRGLVCSLTFLLILCEDMMPGAMAVIL